MTAPALSLPYKPNFEIMNHSTIENGSVISITENGSIVGGRSIIFSRPDGSKVCLSAEDNGGPEWAAYKEWLAEGNTPESPDSAD